MKLFRFPNKAYRAAVIKAYMEQWGYKKAVCFSCGNASRELRKCGVDTMDISDTGMLKARQWFDAGEVKRWFPDCFDATSGHLPIDCLLQVAAMYRSKLGSVPDAINLPTGSGETLIALKLAFPSCKITAVYNLDKATRYEEKAPYNGLVQLLAEEVIYADKVFKV